MKRLIIEKVPLEQFVQMLIDVLNENIVFVDIIVEKGKHQDNIYIINAEEPEEKEEIKMSSNIDFNTLV